MNQEEFKQAFLLALKDEDLKKSLLELVSGTASDPAEQKTLESMKNEIVLLRKELRDRDQKILSLEKEMQTLADDQDNLEQHSRRNTLRIAGVQEELDGEDTVAKVLDLVNNDLELNPPLEIAEVDQIQRVGKPSGQPDKPRAILVKLATYRSRKRVMDLRPAVKDLQRSPKIYFNDDLSKKREKLMYSARQLKRQGKFKGVWSAEGNILIRDNANAVHRINNMNELTLKTPR